jgi:predicted permease
LWRSHFASRDDIVGSPVETRAGSVIIVGVMPEGFLGIAEDEGTDYWIAERQHTVPETLADREEPVALVFGRLKTGVPLSAAAAEVGNILATLSREHPDTNRGLSATLVPFAEKWRADLRPGLVTMLVASLFLLAIGCANVAILLVARLISRESELAVRLAVGASRTDLLRLLAAEGIVLAVAGGGLGLVLSSWLNDLFRTAAGLALPLHLPIVFGAAPLALCAVVVLITGIAFSVLPAAVASRIDSSSALRAGARSVSMGALQGRGGRWLVIGQTALAVALLAGALLFVRSYEKLRYLDWGFRTSNLLRYQISLPRETYTTPESIETFQRQASLDLRAIPGVLRVGAIAPTVPPYDANELDIRLRGANFATANGRLRVNQHFTNNGALEILDVPLRDGRLFGPQDRRGGNRVGLVSETLARAIAPAGSAIGRTLTFGAHDEITVEVVGVVADARWNGQRNRQPSGLNLFLSLDQSPQASVGVVFDTAVDPRSLIDPVRKVLVAREARVALHWIDTMDEALDAQTVGERFWTVLASSYAVTAFLLAALGLYGVLSHGIASRQREIGIRLALGGTSGAVARFIAAQGLRLVVAGLALGLGLVFLFGRLLESRLYETKANDPITLAVVSSTLLLAGLLIAWLPARRAARVSPLVALRSE